MAAQEKEEKKLLKEVEEGREARQQLITQVQEIKICHFLGRFQELSFERWLTFSRHW